MKEITIELNQNIASIVDALHDAEEQDIVLIAPAGARIFQGIVGLKLLKREADNLKKKVFFVTEDAFGETLLRRAGFTVDRPASRPSPKTAEPSAAPPALTREQIFFKRPKPKKIPLPASSSEASREAPSGKKAAHKYLLNEAIPIPIRRMQDIIHPPSASPPAGQAGLQGEEVLLHRDQRLGEDERKEYPPDREALEREEAEAKGWMTEEIPESPAGERYSAAVTPGSVSGVVGKRPLQAPDRDEKHEEETDAADAPTHHQSDYERWARDEEEEEQYNKKFAAWEEKAAAYQAQKEHGTEPARAQEAPGRSRRFTWVLLTFVIGGLLAAAYAALTILPKATIVIKPNAQPVSFPLEVVADRSVSGIDFAASRIPAEIAEERETISKEVPATGEKELTERARGTITIYNEFSSSPQTLVKTTRLISKKDGKLFRTAETIIVPGAKVEGGTIIASSITVEVRADEEGEEYNIGPSEFSIPGFAGTPKHDKFYGKSTAPMRGGARGKVRVVEQKDFDEAQAVAKQEATDSLGKKLDAKATLGLTLLEKARAVEFEKISTSADVGDPGEKVAVTVDVRGRALLFNQEHLKEFVESALRAKIIEGQEVVENSVVVTYNDIKVDFAKGTAKLFMQVEASVAYQIDEGLLKDQLAGSDQGKAEQVLSQIPAKSEVSLWPFWVRRVPADPKKIEVKIQR